MFCHCVYYLSLCMHGCVHIRVRLKIVGHLETMHDSYLPTFWTISLPIIFKRTVYSLACLSVVLGSEIFEWVCLNGRVPPGTAHHPHGHIHAQVRLGRATTRLQQRSHSSTMRSGTTDGGLTTSSLLGQCSLCVLAPRLLLCLHAYIVPNHTYLRAHTQNSRARGWQVGEGPQILAVEYMVITAAVFLVLGSLYLALQICTSGGLQSRMRSALSPRWVPVWCCDPVLPVFLLRPQPLS